MGHARLIFQMPWRYASHECLCLFLNVSPCFLVNVTCVNSPLSSSSSSSPSLLLVSVLLLLLLPSLLPFETVFSIEMALFCANHTFST